MQAACSLFVGALHALAPSLMAGVRVQLQSAAILSNPSDYWISVINVGRACAPLATPAPPSPRHTRLPR